MELLPAGSSCGVCACVCVHASDYIAQAARECVLSWANLFFRCRKAVWKATGVHLLPFWSSTKPNQTQLHLPPTLNFEMNEVLKLFVSSKSDLSRAISSAHRHISIRLYKLVLNSNESDYCIVCKLPISNSSLPHITGMIWKIKTLRSWNRFFFSSHRSNQIFEHPQKSHYLNIMKIWLDSSS